MAKQYTVSDLATHAESIILEAQRNKEPIHVSMGGAAAAVIVDADLYASQMMALAEFDRIFRKEASIRPEKSEE